MDVKTISELMWRRRETLETAINDCLSAGLNKIEDMWLMLVVARWTKDTKFVDYAMMEMEVLKYDREDVKSAARSIVETIKRLKGKEDYIEMERKARREFYNLLAKCLAETLPF